LWGLRADEVRSQNFLNLDIGLPTEKLRADIRAAMTDHTEYREALVPATNRRGKAITCKVTTTSLVSNREVRGAILMMDELAAAGT
jgi:two-component system CheB/CheR fusion protein